jgi:GTP-binding protein Era
MSEDQSIPTRAGFAAIIGAPNAGKSTLVNALVGSKVAIVTHKAQTTRAPLRGILMDGTAQIILLDTPGIFAPRRKLDEAMVGAAWQGAGEADAVLWLVDAARLAEKPDRPLAEDDDIARMLTGLAGVKAPVLLVLNKVDAMPRPPLLKIAEALSKAHSFAAVFMISAKTGDGLPALKAALAGFMPEGPWLYPPDQAADIPMRLLAAEITREQLYLRLHDELPYATTVETDAYEDRKDGSTRIEQTILVERDGHKAIVLGKGGATIKAIGQAARKEIEALLEHKVHLFLHVKQRARWAEEPSRFRDMGLEFPKG